MVQLFSLSLEHKLINITDDVVISDCRFPNEIRALRSSGACIIRVVRGQLPHWWQFAVEHNDQMASAYPQIHQSEWGWANQDFDRVIYNNGSLEDLYAEINYLVRDHRGAKASHL